MPCIHINSLNPSISSAARDERFIAILRGLDQLQCGGLRRILTFQESNGEIVYDGGNFDPATRQWCPLAIGLGLAGRADTELIHSDAEAKIFIVREGRRHVPDFHLNPISGIRGLFYTSERPSDLRIACETILSARGLCDSNMEL